MSDEKQYSWIDIESGVRYNCSKEHYESMQKLWKDVTPKNNMNCRNVPIIIYRTGREINNNKFGKMETQNNKQYFTPKIEDIYVGYECEILKENWKHFIFNVDEIIPVFARVNNETVLSEKIRVPYLTKEQIEAEGWYKINNNYPIQTFKHPIDVNVEVIYNYDTNYLFITIPGKIMFTEPNIEYRANKFSGECKDINTFRKICKLLGI